jgi:hypothetical protein
MKRVEIILLETLILQIGFILPFDIFSTMNLCWEQTVTQNCYGIKYFVYIYVACRDFINRFKNVGGAQAVVANLNFKEESFNLEQSRKPLPNYPRRFQPPSMVLCQYSSNREI